MRVFLDTNIIIDILAKRQPHYADSQDVLDRCGDLQCEVYIAWHGLATAFYIFGTIVGDATAQSAMEGFLKNARVATVGDTEARRAFGLGFTDLEDALQASAAEACAADCIVTRNQADFAKSPVPALTPQDFLAKYPAPAPPAQKP